MSLELVSGTKCFGGQQGVWRLSGLTRTHAEMTEKGQHQRAGAELGLVFVAPDSGLRGAEGAA